MAISDEIQRQMYEAISAGDLHGTLEVVRTNPKILEENWNINDSFLHLAALEGQDKICEALIDHGICVNIPGDGNATPIADSAGYGKLSTTKLLLEKGALVDGLSTSITTPLINASIDGHLDIVKLLLDAGAEINREHLILPQTALDFAIFYKVKNTGQLEVADLLRSHGAIRPYTEKHDWNDVPGQLYIEHIERAVGGFVNPLVVSRIEPGQGKSYAIYKVRIPDKYDYQLLFTVGLASNGFELAICLPTAWPLNRMSLQEERFRWPINMLVNLGRAHDDGLRLDHGYLLNADHPVLAGVGVPEVIRQWLVGINQTIETERGGDPNVVRTLLLIPITTKKLLKLGQGSLELANKKYNVKWGKLVIGP